VVTRASAEHYVWGDAADGYRRLNHADLSVVEERMPPGSREVRHRHGRARQLFFVLDGALQVECDGVVHALERGASLEVPPGVAHAVHNASPADAWFLVISSPTSAGDRQAC
jgi:mannose-6-phosphate isomerase-like protein (cupin superfamily)